MIVNAAMLAHAAAQEIAVKLAEREIIVVRVRIARGIGSADRVDFLPIVKPLAETLLGHGRVANAVTEPWDMLSARCTLTVGLRTPDTETWQYQRTAASSTRIGGSGEVQQFKFDLRDASVTVTTDAEGRANNVDVFWTEPKFIWSLQRDAIEKNMPMALQLLQIKQ